MNRLLAVLVGLIAMLGLAFLLLRWLNEERAVAAGESPGATVAAAGVPAPADGRGFAAAPPPRAAAQEKTEPAAAAPAGTIETRDSGFRDPLFLKSREDLLASVDLSPERLAAVVATVNGEAIRQSDVLDEIVLRQVDGAVEQILIEWLLVGEMESRGWRPTDAEIEKSFADYLRQNRLKDAAEASKKTKFPESYLRFQAMLQVAFAKVLEQDQSSAGEMHPLFMQLWRDETMARSRVDRLSIEGFPPQIAFSPDLVSNPADNTAMLSKPEKRRRREERKKRQEAIARGESVPEPEDGWKPSLRVEPIDVRDRPAFDAFVAAPPPQISAPIVESDDARVVVDLPCGKVAFHWEDVGPATRPLPAGVFGRVEGREIRREDVLPRVLPQLTPGALAKIVDDVVRMAAIRQELKRLGVEPDLERARAAYAAEEAEFAGSFFSFEMYLQYDDSTPRQYFRDVVLNEQIDRVSGAEPDDAQLRQHFVANPVFFGNGSVRASHVLYSPFDPATGLLKGDGAWDEALERARKGAAELRQGLAFDQLVMKETDDAETRKFTEITREESEASGIVIQDPNDRKPKNVKARVAGDISYFPIKKGAAPDPVAAIAFTLREGEWAGPVRSDKGWHLVRVTDIRSPRRLSFDPPPPPDDAPRPGETTPPSPRRSTVYFEERIDDVRRDYLDDHRRDWTDKVLAKAVVEKR